MQSEKTTKEGKQEKQRKTFAVYAVWLARNVLFMVLALLLVKYTLTETAGLSLGIQQPAEREYGDDKETSRAYF